MVKTGNEGISNPQLNLTQLKEISDNDDSFVKEILEIFKINTPQILDEMDKAVATNDHEKLRTAAHRYKSSVNIIGPPALLKEVKELEDDAGDGRDMAFLAEKKNLIKEISCELLQQVDEELSQLTT